MLVIPLKDIPKKEIFFYSFRVCFSESMLSVVEGIVSWT